MPSLDCGDDVVAPAAHTFFLHGDDLAILQQAALCIQSSSSSAASEPSAARKTAPQVLLSSQALTSRDRPSS